MIRTIFILMLLSYCVAPIRAQICDGNLGENIFEEGDFGSGAANILLPDPMIAPGYAYNSSPPPVDGLYVITNNTGAWSGLFTTWLSIRDNSNDPNGYMMVVNASFEPGAFYEQQVDGLCENTLYRFSADIINLIRGNVADHIFPRVSFLIDDVEKYTSGDVPQNGQWNTYGFTFVTEPGQTSITLSLKNNAPGGIGNDLALDNITFQPCGPLAEILPYEVESICEDGMPTELVATVTGEQYDTPVFQWQQSFDEGITWVDIPGANGMTYMHTDLSSGVYYYRYLLANVPGNLMNSKCRVISNNKIIEVIPKFWVTIDTLCEGQVYTAGTEEYTTSGIYMDSLTSLIGCDSIVTLDLTFIPDLGITADVEAMDPTCSGETEGSITIENADGGYPEYSFLLDGMSSSMDNVFLDLLAGMYNVTVIDRFGCVFETSVEIKDPEAFIIDIGEDQQVELGESVNLNLTTNNEIISYTWSPEVIDCEPNCFDLEFFPGNSQIYSLTATSDDGCTATDFVFIEVDKVRRVYIPNVFSPNFDGTNDYFRPYVSVPNVQSIQRMQIFNRWGGVVFDQTDLLPNEVATGWDGTLNGKPTDMGVYVYIIDILFLDGETRSYRGDILIVR